MGTETALCHRDDAPAQTRVHGRRGAGGAEGKSGFSQLWHVPAGPTRSLLARQDRCSLGLTQAGHHPCCPSRDRTGTNPAGSGDAPAQQSQCAPLLLFSWLRVLPGCVIPPACHLHPAHRDTPTGEGPHTARGWQARGATQPAWTADEHAGFRWHVHTQHGLYTHQCTHIHMERGLHTRAHAHTRVHTWLAWIARARTHICLCRQPARPSMPEPSGLSKGQALPEGSRQGKPQQLRCFHPCNTPHQQTRLQPHAALAQCSPGTSSSSRDSPCHRCGLWHTCRTPLGTVLGVASGPPGEPGPERLPWGSRHRQSCGWEAQPDPGKGCVPPSDGAGADPCSCPEPLVAGGHRGRGGRSRQPHGREREARGSSSTA